MYGEIYFHNYCIDRTGENAVLSIRKRDYTGPSTEVDAGVIPFRKTLLNNSEDRIGGVYPTSATIHLIGSPTFGIDDLHTVDDTEYQVVHLIEGQVDWIGYLVPENFSEQEDNLYPTLDLKAIDGLTKLKDLKFVSPTGQNYGVADGIFDRTLLFYITEALKKTGLDLDVLTLADRASVSRSNSTGPIEEVEVQGNPFYNLQFNAPYADGKIFVGGYVEMVLDGSEEFGGGSKFISEIIALDDSDIGDGGGLGVTVNPPPPVYAATYTMTFFTTTPTAGDVLTQATVDARMWVDPDAKIVTEKSELPFPYYYYTDGTYSAWYVLDSIAKLFDMKVTQQQGMWVVETLDKQYVSSDYYRYNKDGVYIDRYPRRAVKVFDCDSVTDLRLAGNVKFIDKTLKRVTVNYPYRYKVEGDPLEDHAPNGNFSLPIKPVGGDPNPETFTPIGWQRVVLSDPITMRYVRENYPVGFLSQSIRIETPGDKFNFQNRLSFETPIKVSTNETYILEWDQSLLEFQTNPVSRVTFNNILIVLKTVSGKRYNLVNSREQPGWAIATSNYYHTSPNPEGQWMLKGDKEGDLAFKSSYATVHNESPTGVWSPFSTVKLVMPNIPEDGELTISLTGPTCLVWVAGGEHRSNAVANSLIPDATPIEGTIAYRTNDRDIFPYETFYKSSFDIKVKVANMRLGRIVDADFGRTVSYTNNGNYYDSLTVEVPLGDEDNTDHLSVIKVGGQVNNLWTDINGTLGVGTIGMMLAKTLMRRYLSPSYGVDGGLISHGLQFLDILDLYDEGSLFGIKNGDLRIKESVFDGTLEEYRINPTPENGFDGGANSLRRESGSGSSRGGGGSTGGSVPPSIAPQNLQSVTEVGNTTTLDISARGLRVSDFLSVPNNAPDEDDIVDDESYMWLGDGATAGVPDAGTLVGLSDVNITSPTNGQALVWDSATSKWVNGDVASGGGTWGSITGVLSNQTDLMTALNSKQNVLVSGTNIKTINGQSILGSGNIVTPNTTYTATNGISISGSNVISPVYGTTAGTIAQGNDSRINNGQTAYEWGDYRQYGLGTTYQTAPSITDPNSITESMFFTITGPSENLPSSGGGWVGIHVEGRTAQRRSMDIVMQPNSSTNTSLQYRRIVNDNYSPWIVLWDSSNLRSNAQNDARYMQVTAPANSITTGDIANWNTAYSQRHTHANKTLLDVINQNLATSASVQFSGANIVNSLVVPTIAPTSPLNGNLWIGDGATAGIPDVGTLVGLSDVNITSPTNGQALVWNSSTSKWENATVSSGGGTWGSITGVLSNQTDLMMALNSKQDVLVSGTNIKTINGVSVLGSGNIVTPNTTYTANNGISISGSNVISPVYGTTAGTVAQGNDSRINNGQTAYSWGNHAGLYPNRAGFGGSANSVRASDTRNTNPLPSTDLQRGVWFDFKQMSTIGTGTGSSTYGASMTFVPYWDDTGNNYSAFRLTQSSSNTTNIPQLFVQKYRAGSWHSQYRIWHEGNLSQSSIDNWNTAYSQRHTHANKALLDGINQSLATTASVQFSGANIVNSLVIPTIAPTSPLNGNLWIGDGATAGIPDVGTLVGLSDVNITSPTNGQALVWNSATSKWENANVSSGGGTWGSITGVLSNQTDLMAALNSKQNVLVSGTNIKTINGQSILGSGNIVTPNTTYTATNGISISGSNVISPVYGTTAGTIAQGNDSRINNGQTAYEWGDYRQYGLGTTYQTAPSITDPNSITESMFFTITGPSENLPSSGGGWVGIHVEGRTAQRRSMDIVMQPNSSTNTSLQYRRIVNDNYSPWIVLWDSSNLRSNAQNDARYMQVTAPANGITAGDITNWNTAYSQRHSHSNKAFLDTVNQNMGTSNTVTFDGIIATTRLRIPTSAPSSPANGEIWIDTSS